MAEIEYPYSDSGSDELGFPGVNVVGADQQGQSEGFSARARWGVGLLPQLPRNADGHLWLPARRLRVGLRAATARGRPPCHCRILQ